MSSILDLALSYTDMGLYVFPCKPYGDPDEKAPYTKHGFQDSTSDPEQVRRWWSHWPDAMIGIDCGRSGLVVVDLDVKGGKNGPAAWSRFLDGRQVPATFNVRTPSGGWHGWYRANGVAYKTCADEVAEGVDVRATGGYVIGPGPYGYTWHAEQPLSLDDVPPMPAGVLPERAAGGAAGHWQHLDRGQLHPADLAGLEALEGLGGHDAYQADGYVAVTRPGKVAGTSASIGHVGPGLVKVFTPNWPGLDEGAIYDPDQLTTIAEPKPSTAVDSSAEPVSLVDGLATFRKWLHLDDEAPVLATAATIVANLAEGDPVWLLIVGPPSGGKTEVLQSASRLPYIIPAATISEAALLSGTSKRERAQDATGGLLRQVGGFGILLAKDFTSVLSQNWDTAKAAMAALREIYDGSWDRPVGSDGGRVLRWAGKCGFVGGVTPSYDRYAAVVSALGDRFLLLRLPDVDASAQAGSALHSSEHEKAMRAELSAAMAGLIAGADTGRVHTDLTDHERDRLVALASFTARARTGVERDGYSKELLVLPQAEGPARLVKAIRRLYGGLAALGVDETTRWAVLERVAVDCAPAIRVPLMTTLLDSSEPLRTSDIAKRVGMVTKTAHMQLDNLALLGIAERTKTSDADNAPDLWQASDWLRQHWPRKVRTKTTTRRVGVIKEGAGDSDQDADTHTPFTAPRSFRSHSDGDPIDPETGRTEEADR